MSLAKARRVCLIHTGGTIGMQRTEGGYVPDMSVLERVMAEMPQLRHPDVPGFELVCLDPLLDSADMRPADWVRIANAIRERYAHFDGFVVLHGTDTMAYTASALSFLLGSLDKAVVMTGAQLSIDHVRSDGREHLITALIIAASQLVHEVVIYFGGQLMRGNRTQKISANTFIGFESGNCPPLARVGTEIRWTRRAELPGGRAALTVVRDPEVIAVRVYPGISVLSMERLLAPPTEAVVLETYGTGNFPTQEPALLQVVRDAVDRGVVVVNCSQCHSGAVRQALYSTGAKLSAAGVISGEDMTPEAALTKLHCLLGAGLSPAEVRHEMSLDLAGEMTAKGEVS